MSSDGVGGAPPEYASLGEEARVVLGKVALKLNKMGKAWFARAMRTIADKVTDTLSPHVSPEMLQRLQRSQTRVDAQQEAQAKRRRQQVAEARERSPAAEEEAEPPSATATATAAAAPDAPP
eukprot:EG_transcript_49991